MFPEPAPWNAPQTRWDNNPEEILCEHCGGPEHDCPVLRQVMAAEQDGHDYAENLDLDHTADLHFHLYQWAALDGDMEPGQRLLSYAVQGNPLTAVTGAVQDVVLRAFQQTYPDLDYQEAESAWLGGARNYIHERVGMRRVS